MAGVYPHTWFILSLRNEERASWCWVSTLLTSFHLQQVGYFLKDTLCLYHTLPSRRLVQRLETFKSYPGTFLLARIWGGLEWFHIFYLPNFTILLVVWKSSSAPSPPLRLSRLHRTALVLNPGMRFECWYQQRGSEVSPDPLSWLARLRCSTLSGRHCCFVCSLWEHRSSAAFVTWVAILLSFVLLHLLKFFSTQHVLLKFPSVILPKAKQIKASCLFSPRKPFPRAPTFYCLMRLHLRLPIWTSKRPKIQQWSQGFCRSLFLFLLSFLLFKSFVSFFNIFKFLLQVCEAFSAFSCFTS